MPTWHTMNELVTGDLVTEADMAALRENLSYLLAPNHARVLYTGGTVTTTSTAYVDLAPADLTLTLETHGGPLLVTFTGNLYAGASSHRVYIDVVIDGVSYTGAVYGVLQQSDLGTSLDNARPANFALLVPDLAAGSHTVGLRWRVSGGSSVSLVGSTVYTPATLAAIEL